MSKSAYFFMSGIYHNVTVKKWDFPNAPTGISGMSYLQHLGLDGGIDMS